MLNAREITLRRAGNVHVWSFCYRIELLLTCVENLFHVCQYLCVCVCVTMAVTMGCCLLYKDCVPVALPSSVGSFASPLLTEITSKYPCEHVCMRACDCDSSHFFFLPCSHTKCVSELRSFTHILTHTNTAWHSCDSPTYTAQVKQSTGILSVPSAGPGLDQQWFVVLKPLGFDLHNSLDKKIYTHIYIWSSSSSKSFFSSNK